MANAKEVGLCPKCQAELPSGTLTKCGTCGFQFPYQTEVFGTPDYLCGQLKAVVERIPLAEKNRKHYEDKMRLAHLKFLVNMSDDDRVSAMQDAFDILTVLITSNATAENFRRIVELGKRIGALADANDKLIKSGGILNGIFDTAQPRVGRKDPLEPGGEGDPLTP